MKVLIIYEEIPESTKFFDADVAADEWKWMRLTHGNFINTDMTKKQEDACQKLSVWLENRPPFDAKVPISASGFEYVLHTGFVL